MKIIKNLKRCKIKRWLYPHKFVRKLAKILLYFKSLNNLISIISLWLAKKNNKNN